MGKKKRSGSSSPSTLIASARTGWTAAAGPTRLRTRLASLSIVSEDTRTKKKPRGSDQKKKKATNINRRRVRGTWSFYTSSADAHIRCSPPYRKDKKQLFRRTTLVRSLDTRTHTQHGPHHPRRTRKPPQTHINKVTSKRDIFLFFFFFRGNFPFLMGPHHRNKQT